MQRKNWCSIFFQLSGQLHQKLHFMGSVGGIVRFQRIRNASRLEGSISWCFLMGLQILGLLASWYYRISTYLSCFPFPPGIVCKRMDYKEHDFRMAPVFMTPLTDRTVVAGYTTALNCAVRGHPKVCTEWGNRIR